MRNLAVWTTTAAVALLGVANAQSTGGAAPAASSDLQTEIAAYAAYQADVGDLRTLNVRTANQLEEALDRVGHHNPGALTRGWIAYGAATAAQSPTYIQGVRDAAAYYGRDAVIWAVTVDPSYARGLRGANDATRLVVDSANADAARILNVAERYQEMGYSLQRQSWGRAVAPRQAARVQRVRSLGTQGAPPVASEVSQRLSVAPLTLSPASDPTAFGGRRFWDSLRGGPDTVQVSSNPVTYQWRANPEYARPLDRMAAAAALQVLDADASHRAAMTQLISDPDSTYCFEMAQRQLYQCLSAARFHYENAFCLGRHGLGQIAEQCIGKVAQPDTAALSPIPAGGGGRD